MADAFAARFARELRSLTLNSSPLIASLTMLAADGAGVAGAGVVDAVGRHVRTVRVEREGRALAGVLVKTGGRAEALGHLRAAKSCAHVHV